MMHHLQGDDMDITGILAALRERAPWPDARRIIAMANLQPSQGWDKTISRYTGVDVEDDEFSELSSSLVEHILAGEKAIRLYRLSASEKNKLRAFARAQVVSPTPFSVAFPEKVAVGGSGVPSGNGALCATFDDGDGIFLVYSTIREFEVRERVEIDQLDEDVREALENFSRLVGVRVVRSQVFDVLWIPPQGDAIYAAVDSPKGMPADFISAGHAKLRKVIRDGVGSGNPDPENLFTVVSAIYNSPWGTVRNLGFLTDSGSVKFEKMRLDCLRAEPFHQGGKEAVDGVIHPFSITVRWDRKSGDYTWSPELELHSTSIEAQNPVPTLYDVYFRSGINVRDLRELRRRLKGFLP